MIKFIVEFEKEVQEGHENVHPFQISDLNEKFIIGEASSRKQFIKMNFINYPHFYENIKKLEENVCISFNIFFWLWKNKKYTLLMISCILTAFLTRK